MHGRWAMMACIAGRWLSIVQDGKSLGIIKPPKLCQKVTNNMLLLIATTELPKRLVNFKSRELAFLDRQDCRGLHLESG